MAGRGGHCGLDEPAATALQDRGRLIRHARYFTLQFAESCLTRPLFRQILARIEQLSRGTRRDRADGSGRSRTITGWGVTKEGGQIANPGRYSAIRLESSVLV